MKTETLIILKSEQELLKKHYKDANLTDFNKNKLSTELNAARIISEDELPADVVCLNSEIEFRETLSGQKYHFRIVSPADANIKERKISVFAPLAIALLGYRQGAKVEWEMPSGLRTFEILMVRQNRV